MLTSAWQVAEFHCCKGMLVTRLQRCASLWHALTLSLTGCHQAMGRYAIVYYEHCVPC